MVTVVMLVAGGLFVGGGEVLLSSSLDGMVGLVVGPCVGSGVATGIDIPCRACRPSQHL
jgi:hypothetical protein